MDLMDAKKVKCCSRDTINSFPDEILAKIISFLPTKRAASTCLVSKRWRNLFALMFQLFSSQHHLDLDYSDLVYPEEGKRERKDVEKSFGDFVDKTLSSYNSIIKKLSLKCPRSCLHTEIDQWLSHALERGGVVDLDMRIPIGFTRVQSKWPSVFTIKTLVKLTLEIELGPERISFYPLVFLPVLKSLFLHTAWYTCEDLCYKMFPILEELSLQHLRGLPVNYPTLRRQRRESKVYYISHKTLKRLTSHYNNSLDNCRHMRFDTPSLVYLDYSGFAPTSTSTANFLDSLVEAKLDVFLDSNLHHDVNLRQTDEVLVDLSTIMNWMRNVKTLSLSSLLLLLRICIQVVEDYLSSQTLLSFILRVIQKKVGMCLGVCSTNLQS
ncbi:putative F-box/LRR-repeat protein At5g25860 isoform X1 [Arabidopsis lyrata subsp. lyrata]|uniref:putative F-box/LRR-repeat protein At5g25860 isoform X1 n=1 Tax=Arabidopsis lyrata subsp. lyrata TaxID=81972 RepID=UPI000A29D3BB|nr:putative F-box/LRR-repeat protein At5g25860 isoform X1 [Arabidopsis lyrata subsp. lyrata]|eukprot:XP_020884018.1 putative F-box/LRR-repeat protein At5g25860 isoform X1 [Arabidopsis lyrata subsp. lyrata]